MKATTNPGKQSGAALVVGLVLLVVVTVLAISGMNTATTELAIARNDQNYENAFQAAESGLAIALSQPSFPTTGLNLGVLPINANDEVAVQIQYVDSTMVPEGGSIGVGAGGAAHHFIATATADSKRAGTASGVDTDRDASAVHTQGFYIIGPDFSSL
jgi:type IV pilus assembly protein PilX